MATLVFRLFDLPWSPVAEDDRRFRALTLSALILSLLLGALAYWVPLPPEERRQVQALPPRLAQLVIEQRRTPPPAPQVEEQPKEEPKPVEPAQEEPKPVETAQETPPKPEPKPEEKPLPLDPAAEARKKAAKSGLLAFSDQLADLRDTSVVDALTGNQALSKGAAETITRRDILTAGGGLTGGGSGGIDTARLSSGLTGTTALAGRDTTQVESSVKLPPKPVQDDKKKAPATPTRTYEEVIRVIDSSKGAIFALYNRALRQNPALQGKVVLEISIAPDGGVTECRIVSSELGDEEMERKLVARIKLLQFGAREVEPMVVTYPIDFLPS